MKHLLCLVLLMTLFLPGLVQAEAFVCGITATTGKFSRYVPSIDPTKMKAHGNETCSQIQGDSATAEQTTLYTTTPQRYIKVVTDATVGGIVQPLSMAVMDPAEQNAVDTAITAEAAKNAEWKTATETEGVCKHPNVASVDAKMQQAADTIVGYIDSMTLVAADKTKLKQAFQVAVTSIAQVTKCDIARASGG